jgi:hypothetical protein
MTVIFNTSKVQENNPPTTGWDSLICSLHDQKNSENHSRKSESKKDEKYKINSMLLDLENASSGFKRLALWSNPNIRYIFLPQEDYFKNMNSSSMRNVFLDYRQYICKLTVNIHFIGYAGVPTSNHR